WLLSEHRIAGAQALIPGTGFVELARAAFVETGHQLLSHLDANAIELTRVTFLQPFQVGAQDTVRLQIEVRLHGDSSSVMLQSDNGDVRHMTAEVRRCAMPRDQVELATLRAQCPQQLA